MPWCPFKSPVVVASLLRQSLKGRRPPLNVHMDDLHRTIELDDSRLRGVRVADAIAEQGVPSNASAASEVIRDFGPDFLWRMQSFAQRVFTEDEYPVSPRSAGHIPRITHIRERIESRSICRATCRNTGLLDKSRIFVPSNLAIHDEFKPGLCVLVQGFQSVLDPAEGEGP